MRIRGRQFKWTLVPEYPIRRHNQPPLRADAALLDDFRLVRGLWEAKDEHDDLEKEVRHKLDAGYPDRNIVFQAPRQAILVQGGALVEKEDISKPDALADQFAADDSGRVPHPDPERSEGEGWGVLKPLFRRPPSRFPPVRPL